LVAEYAGPLPVEGTKLTRAQAIEATSHLQPPRAHTQFGRLLLDRELPRDPGPIAPEEGALADDAEQRARALAAEPGGQIAAAALAAATAVVVRHPTLRARLLYAAADYEVPA